MSTNAHAWGLVFVSSRPYPLGIQTYPEPRTQEAKAMDTDKTPDEPRVDDDLPVEDENAEQITGGHFHNAAEKPTRRVRR
jgi:hypothetical protein